MQQTKEKKVEAYKKYGKHVTSDQKSGIFMASLILVMSWYNCLWNCV